MALFRRKASEPDNSEHTPTPSVELDDDGLTATPVQPLRQQERSHLAKHLNALAAEGVDIEDLASLSQGLDESYTRWARERDHDHSQIVERYAVGIGEHLSRATDLRWALVTDVFGTDLGLVEGPQATFMVVPNNLVGARWMRGETGWVPAVVGHLVRRRSR
ncbi:MAG: hypothetical protein WA892_11805 [Ornithinimicrobium sp.]